MIHRGGPSQRQLQTEDERFAFGANWMRFVAKVDAQRIEAAESSIREMLGVDDLHGVRFLDAGCGSGLFSLAAHRLGATVYSFDYDCDSVAASQLLRSRHAPGASDWTIEQGSILDVEYVRNLGTFDVVYSWGVLHHTGAMWDALANAISTVAPRGLLAISLYNDQGHASQRWLRLKRAYNRSGRAGRAALIASSAVSLYWRGAVARLVRATRAARDDSPRGALTSRPRGMSRWHDLVDWVGGYPFEVSRPEEVFAFVSARGFELTHLKTCGGGIGCNEYTFRKTTEALSRRDNVSLPPCK